MSPNLLFYSRLVTYIYVLIYVLAILEGKSQETELLACRTANVEMSGWRQHTVLYMHFVAPVLDFPVITNAAVRAWNHNARGRCIDCDDTWSEGNQTLVITRWKGGAAKLIGLWTAKCAKSLLTIVGHCFLELFQYSSALELDPIQAIAWPMSHLHFRKLHGLSNSVVW
jgi:hypothetical protein